MRDAVERITAALPRPALGGDELFRASLKRSLILSVDMAHALHPNYAAKHEANHGPLLNKGTVIKTNNNQRYATSVRARPPAAPPRAENKTRVAPTPPLPFPPPPLPLY